METTRRAFMGAAAGLAASMAVGIGSRVKTHGPVELKTEIFGPITLKSYLLSDKDRDLFRVRIVPKTMENILVDFKLSRIEQALWEGKATAIAKAWNNIGRSEVKVLAIAAEGKLTFHVPEQVGSTPFVLELADVCRVL